MGALTLKSFPFELRGWDIEKFESLDPTDGFGSNTRVYISKDQVVLIEPDYNSQTFNTWLTDKGRQYFDGIFNKWEQDTGCSDFSNEYSWNSILSNLKRTLYIFDHCSNLKSKSYFFTIVFENVSIEVLSILMMLTQNYSFLKLRRSETFQSKHNDLESEFQINVACDKNKLQSSSFCLLLGTNPRYEGYLLNLNLRQRFLKGNFKCVSIGSLVDLTFPISFLGSSVYTLKSIAEGNNLTCQDLKFAKNPLVIYNNELFKRNDSQDLLQLIKSLKYASVLTKSWNGFNNLNSSLSETGIQTLGAFLPLRASDFSNFSCLYFLNVSANSSDTLNKIVSTRLLNYKHNSSAIEGNKTVIDQNFNFKKNRKLFNQISSENKDVSTKYFYLPSSMFYENEETFISTDGLVKRTTKLISKKESRNSWQILRRIFKELKTNLIFLNPKNNEIIFFNCNKISNFKNFISFHYYASRSLNNLNFYLNIQNKPFQLNESGLRFKESSGLVINTKLRYFIDDFFIGGKDEYSHNSLVMINCSNILRKNATNFL